MSQLSPGTKLIEVITMDTISVPDCIHRAMEQLRFDETMSTAQCAELLDFGLPRVRAIETAGEIAATVLQTGYCVHVQ